MTQTPLDPAQFKSGMRRLAGGVALVTTRHGDVRQGLIATAVTSLSADPPSLLVCVNETASIHGAMTAADAFCVNLLSNGQDAVAARFASSKDRETRFEVGDWTDLATGAPALRQAQVSFDCRAAGSARFGTHTVFFGEIVALTDWGTACDPMIYHDGRFRRLDDTPDREAA